MYTDCEAVLIWLLLLLLVVVVLVRATPTHGMCGQIDLDVLD